MERPEPAADAERPEPAADAEPAVPEAPAPAAPFAANGGGPDPLLAPPPGDVPGLRDLLPDEAEAMREIQEAALAEMRRWGYRFVVTPSLESQDALALGLDAEHRRRLFKLTDRDGTVLALVGERTVPVARLVAGKLRSAPLPQRLCYAGPVLTNDPGRLAHRREAHQSGAELVGAAGPVADAEVIAMAVRCLDAAGLRRYQVDVGHAEFFQGLLDGLDVHSEVKSGIRAMLARRDFVALKAVLDETPLRGAEHELLLRFPALRGGGEILDAARALVRNRRSARALEELETVHQLLQAYGLGDHVGLDLGAIRDFTYYTGVIFEGYGPDLGRPLAQGGRYDQLLERFGRPAPATGFVLHLDLVGEALARSEAVPELTRLDVAVGWSRAGREAALRLGSTLRLFGMRAIVDTQPRGVEAARAWAGALGARDLLHVGRADRVFWLGPDGGRRRVPIDRVVGELGVSRGRTQ